MAKRWLVFMDTGVSVEMPDEIDPNTPDGLLALKAEAADRLAEAVANEWFDIKFERDEEEGY